MRREDVVEVDELGFEAGHISLIFVYPKSLSMLLKASVAS